MITTERIPCRSLDLPYSERRWWWFLLASLTMPVLIGLPLLLWNLGQRAMEYFAKPDAPRKRKNWQSRMNMALSTIVSDQTKTGQLLKVVGFLVSVGSLCIYLEETSRPCMDTEMCQPWFRNIWWLVDMNFNTYLLVYYILRLFATNQKLRFMFQPTSFADYFTIPSSFLAIYLHRNWFGFRFLRIINLGWAIDLLHRWRILKNIAQVQLMRLGVTILVFIVSGGGAFLMLECNGDPWNVENTYQSNLTIWDYAYFSVVTISTVGYGDISAVTTVGRIFSTIFIFVCVIYTATLISQLARLLPAPQRYPIADRNLNFNHVIVCGHVNYEMASQFLSDFYDEAKTKEKIQIVFLHPDEPDDPFVALLNLYQTTVEYIKGSPLNDADLERARALNASACLVFANLRASDPDADDAATVLRVLSIKNFCPTIKVQVSVIKTSTLNFLRKYPSIDLKRGDVIFCFKNLKNGLIGINCRVPGSATILSDLIAARSPAETWPENCPELYALGRKMKPFSVPFSSSFWGLNFKEVASICYRKLRILLVGVYETFEESGEQSNFIPNPGSSFIITELCRGQIICATSRESVRASIYCDRCHPDVNPEKMKKCHCQRWKMKRKHKAPTVKISGPDKPNINGPEAFSNNAIEYNTRPETSLGPRSSCYANSMNKRFFTDRRPSFTTEEKMKLPRKSLSEAVLMQFKRSMSVPADHAEALMMAKRTKPMFDSTGMFWWTPPQSFEDCVMTLDQAAIREFSDHMLICMLAEGQSPATGIHDIILPLRSSVLPYEDLKDIVILGSAEVIRLEWHFINTTPKIYIVEGSATVIAALRACYIDRCNMCVMLSGGLSAAKIDTSEDLVLADRDVIVATLNIKALEFTDTNTPDNASHPSYDGCFPYLYGTQIPIISSLEYERSVRFLSQDRNYLDFRYTFAHMSGSVVVSTALDSMMTSIFYNPGLAMSFTQLIYGGESTEFERAFAEGVGLVGGEIEDMDDLDNDMGVHWTTISSNSRRLKIELKLMSMKHEMFQRLEGLTYADLWSYALVNYDMICMGLYLLERDTEEKKVKKSHKGKRYVASNPPGHVRLHSSDQIYVLMPSIASKVLTACVFAERDTFGTVYDYDRSEVALEMATEYSNDYIVPPEYRIHVLYRDIGQICSGKNHVVGHAMSLLQEGVKCDVFIGPGCGLAAESLNDFAEFYDIPIIGCPAAGVGLSAPIADYRIVSRVSITYSTVTACLLLFFHHFNYTTPIVFQDLSINFFQQMGVLMQATMRQLDPQEYYASTFVKFESEGLQRKTIVELLQNAHDTSRVIIICADAITVRRIMIVAREVGMANGDYVFITVEMYPSGIWGTYDWYRNDTYDPIAKEAFEFLLILSIEFNINDAIAEFWRKALEYSLSRYNYTFKNPKVIDPVVTHFYDAMVMYANVVKSMLASNLSFVSGEQFASFVSGFTFLSPLNGNVTFNNDSDRQFDYVMRSMDYKSGKYGNLINFPASTKSLRVLGKIEWGGSEVLPPNTPRCGFKGDNPVCLQEASAMKTGGLIASVVTPVVILFVVTFVAVFIVKRFFDSHSDPYWWRIFTFEMDFPAEKHSAVSSKSLTKSVHSHKSGEAATKAPNGHTPKTNDDDDLLEHPEPVVAGHTASYHGQSVTLQPLPEPLRRAPNSLSDEAAQVRALLHPNIQKFVGIAVDETNICEYIVGEVCPKGTLRDLIEDRHMNLDWEFKNSLIKDIVNGMTYLHGTSVGSHGALSDENCLVDSRFVLKITGIGLRSLRDYSNQQPVSQQTEDRDYRVLLWRAPEHLRRLMPSYGTQKGDVYSFAILLQQIILRSDPYQMKPSHSHHKKDAEHEQMAFKDIVLEVRRGLVPQFRPPVPLSACPKGFHPLLESCWDEDPAVRPPFIKLRQAIIKIVGRSGDNIVDYLIHQMEKHAVSLEHEVERQMKQFMLEKQRSADILSGMLPKTIADALTKGRTVLPETFESTTVYFSDVNGFTEAVEQTQSPLQIVDILNGLYNVCDNVIPDYDVFKVETVSDAYMIVSGLPIRNGIRHIEQIASMALVLRKEVGSMKLDAAPHVTFRLRVGINSGPCVASVVGLKMPRYCLFGDTVNTSSRMESHGEAGKIHCSPTAKELLDKFEEFVVVLRGTMNVKGKGPMETYWLVGKTSA